MARAVFKEIKSFGGFRVGPKVEIRVRLMERSHPESGKQKVVYVDLRDFIIDERRRYCGFRSGIQIPPEVFDDFVEYLQSRRFAIKSSMKELSR